MRQTQPKLLLVDDEPSLATPIAMLLKDQGYQVATAGSGEEAMGVASWYAPDILLSDVQMGSLNGVDAARAIVDRLPHCRVLLASGQIESLRLVAQANADGYDFQFLSKPYAIRELIARLSRMAQTIEKPPIADGLGQVS